MKFLYLITFIFLISCGKDDSNSNLDIVDTDSNGNIIKGDTNKTKFVISDSIIRQNRELFYGSALGFMPKNNQNCNANIKLIMFPNPCPNNINPVFKIVSDQKLVYVWHTAGQGNFQHFGDIIPASYILEDSIYMNEGTNIYSFIVATEDSCAYMIQWKLVRK
jgi:hypothetical protein